MVINGSLLLSFPIVTGYLWKNIQVLGQILTVSAVQDKTGI